MDTLKQTNVVEPLKSHWLREICLSACADDVGFVELERPSLVDERPHIMRTFPNRVVADEETWLGFLAKEKNLLWSVVTRKIRLHGNPKWFLSFKRCFPS